MYGIRVTCISCKKNEGMSAQTSPPGTLMISQESRLQEVFSCEYKRTHVHNGLPHRHMVHLNQAISGRDSGRHQRPKDVGCEDHR